MSTNLIYGVVVGGVFYSNRIERRVAGRVDNGIYSLDMDADDFWSTLSLANIVDAVSFFRRASKVRVLRGVAFHDSIVPDNPVAFPQIPLPVMDGQFEEFEYIEVAILRNKVNYFLQTLATNESMVLFDVRDCFEKKGDVTKLKGVTAPMRIVYSFHEIERKRKEMAEPVNAIKLSMETSGAEIISVRPSRSGFEVSWRMMGHTLQTLIGKDLRVLHAGFCVSGYDKDHSAKSLPNLLKDYVQRGDRVNITRTH